MIYVIGLIGMILGIVMMFENFLLGFIILIISSIVTVVANNEINENAYFEKQRINSLTEEERKKELLDKEIDYTILVGGDSKKSVGSAIVRGAVGSALFGPVGLVGGAISGKNKSKTTFTIVYKSGRREVRTVDNDTSEFNAYARYLK